MTGPKTRHCLMVGAGLSGAVIGRMLAEDGLVGVRVLPTT